MSSISIIIPVLNEATCLNSLLVQLEDWRNDEDEVIFVDGGSEDASRNLILASGFSVIKCEPGRAKQLNQGAMSAKGDILWFLHVDSDISEISRESFLSQAHNESSWGFFKIKISDKAVIFRVIAFCMNCRARCTRVATGDQGIFVSKSLFIKVGAYPDIKLMEDIELSCSLRHRSAPIILRGPINTSARRWRKNGVIQTILLMWVLRMGWFLGCSDRTIRKLYDGW
jgi:rSAM/selenodomain-associated transferase 2